MSCQSVRYIAMKKDPELCTDIMLALQGEHNIDNSGAWSTRSQYAFARSMISAFFFGELLDEHHHSFKNYLQPASGFETTTSGWSNVDSTQLYNAFKKMDEGYSTRPSIYNVVDMVTPSTF